VKTCPPNLQSSTVSTLTLTLTLMTPHHLHTLHLFLFHLFIHLFLLPLPHARTITHLPSQSHVPQPLVCTKPTSTGAATIGVLRSTVSVSDQAAWLQTATNDCRTNNAEDIPSCVDILLTCYTEQVAQYSPFIIVQRSQQCYDPGCLRMTLLVQATGNVYQLLLHDEDQEQIHETALWFAMHVSPDDMVVPNSEHSLMKVLLSAWPGQLAAQETPWVNNFPLRIPPKFLQHGKIVSDRYALLDAIRAGHLHGSPLPTNPVVMEIGVANGNYSLNLLHRLQVGVLHLVDLSISPGLLHNVQEFLTDDNSGRVRVYEGDSGVTLSEESRLFRSSSFDLIYIDAGHTYDAVLSDFLNAARLIKQDGLILFNDYTEFGGDVTGEHVKYGVIEVVHEACVFHGFEMVAITLAPYTFRDVALRKRV
jgi:hypothetical protein